MEATSIAAISAYAKSAAPLPDGDNRSGAIEVSATVANGRVKKTGTIFGDRSGQEGAYNWHSSISCNYLPASSIEVSLIAMSVMVEQRHE